MSAAVGRHCLNDSSIKVVLREAAHPPVTMTMMMFTVVVVARASAVRWFRVVDRSHGDTEGRGW